MTSTRIVEQSVVSQVFVGDDEVTVIALEQGGVGPAGPPGPPGADSTVAVGTTTTGVPGSNASVVNSGSPSAAVLDFTIPRGDQGVQGVPGAAASVAAGSTTTGAPGSSASVVNSGTSAAAVFDFTIPRGDQGVQGVPGPQGDDGIEVSAVAPVNTSILWADTSEPGDAVVPVGGSTGQSLVKLSSSDYDTGWSSSVVPSGGATGQVLAKSSGTDYDTAWQQRAVSISKPRTGFYYGAPIATFTTQTYNVYRWAQPLILDVETEFDRIAVEVTTAGAAGSLVRLGIYAQSTDAMPGALILDAGTVAVDSTGLKDITISQTLAAGVYWLAAGVSTPSGTVALRSSTNIPWRLQSWPTTDLNAGKAGWVNLAGTSGALPDPFPTTNIGAANVTPIVRLRAA